MTDSEIWLALSSELLKETVLKNPYIPHTPTAKQALFLAVTDAEALFGGAAGGGKSDALLMGALQFAHVPNYAALLLRRTFADLSQPGALIPRSHEWLAKTDARWLGMEHAWRFPSGAIVKFGYLDSINDVYQYQSSEFQYMGFDELTQFEEFQYRYMFSRVRRLKQMNVPLRVRSGSNPGGLGHEWVKRRFITEGKSHGRYFIPAKLSENPFLDEREYVKALNELDPITREQLLNGDWTVRHSGSIFKREWFSQVIPQAPADLDFIYRYWDLAATEEEEGKEPDWTAGALVGYKHGIWYIMNVTRFRETPAKVEKLIKSRASSDPYGTRIRMEQEPGASGKSIISHYSRNVLSGYDFLGVPSIKDKQTRAAPFSSAAESGNVVLVQGEWIGDCLDELEAFRPGCLHDDQVDAITGAYMCIRTGGQFQAESVDVGHQSAVLGHVPVSRGGLVF